MQRPMTSEVMMERHKVVSREEWLAARSSPRRRRSPDCATGSANSVAICPGCGWTRNTSLKAPRGQEALSQLFDGRHQPGVYHFMLGPDRDEGCKSCSFWADNFNGIDVHLRRRDVSFPAISRA